MMQCSIRVIREAKINIWVKSASRYVDRRMFKAFLHRRCANALRRGPGRLFSSSWPSLEFHRSPDWNRVSKIRSAVSWAAQDWSYFCMTIQVAQDSTPAATNPPSVRGDKGSAQGEDEESDIDLSDEVGSQAAAEGKSDVEEDWGLWD